MFSNEPPSRPPARQRVEIQTKDIDLTPWAVNERHAFLTRRPIAYGVNRQIEGGRAKARARARQAITGDLAQTPVGGERLNLPHLFRRQSARNQMEIIDPQEIARSWMMTSLVDQRQEQCVHPVDRDRR